MELGNLLNIKDTVISKNGTPLGGVIYFSMKSGTDTSVSYGGKELYEILSGEAWEIVSILDSYTITLKQYACDFSDFGKNSFTLNFSANGSVKTFSGCQLVSSETYVDDKGKLITVSIINAERMS